jgi:hypothetical protein
MNNTKVIKHAVQANAKINKQKNRKAANQLKLAEKAMEKNPCAELSKIFRIGFRRLRMRQGI